MSVNKEDASCETSVVVSLDFGREVGWDVWS